jgi:hypothetical protein
MTDRLAIEGWEVAQVELERSWSGTERVDRCWLFRSASGWTWVTMRRHTTSGDQDQPTEGRAVVTSEVFATVDEVAEHVRGQYHDHGWVQVLDAGRGHDDELRRQWVPERIRRDFDGASVYVKDLARSSALLGGRPQPAPAREMPDWQDLAVARIAAHLEGLGFDVDDEPVGVFVEEGSRDPLLGGLRVRRYGWEAVGVVRVDDVGEVFIRVPDPDDVDVDGPLFRPVPGDAA